MTRQRSIGRVPLSPPLESARLRPCPATMKQWESAVHSSHPCVYEAWQGSSETITRGRLALHFHWEGVPRANRNAHCHLPHQKETESQLSTIVRMASSGLSGIQPIWPSPHVFPQRIPALGEKWDRTQSLTASHPKYPGSKRKSLLCQEPGKTLPG